MVLYKYVKNNDYNKYIVGIQNIPNFINISFLDTRIIENTMK